MTGTELLTLASGWVALGFLAALGVVLIWRMATGKIILTGIISEEDSGKASLSRLQFLIFTFVIAGGLVHIVLKSDNFPALNSDIFLLLGISAGSYLGGKFAGNQQGVASKADTAGTQGADTVAGSQGSDTLPRG